MTEETNGLKNTYLWESAAHFDEVGVGLEEQRDVDLSEHDRLFEGVPLKSGFDTRRTLLLLRQGRLDRLQLEVRRIHVASKQRSRLLVALENYVVDLAALALARTRQVLV